MIKLCKNRQQIVNTKNIKDRNRHETGVKCYTNFFLWDIVIEIDDFEFSSQLLSRYLWVCVGPCVKIFLQNLADIFCRTQRSGVFPWRLGDESASVNRETFNNNRRN